MWEWQQDFPQWNPPALVQNRAFLVSLMLFLYSHGAQTTWLYQRPGEALKFQDISSSFHTWKYTLGPSWSFSLCPLTFLKQKVFSCLLKTVEKNMKMQVVWRVSAVNSGKHPNRETSLKPWFHLNSTQKVNPGNCSSESDGKWLQAILSSCQHQW